MRCGHSWWPFSRISSPESTCYLMPTDPLQNIRDQLRRRRDRRRIGRHDGRQHSGPSGPIRAAGRTALQARRTGHLVSPPRRTCLRRGPARVSRRHDQKLPPLLEPRNRRLDRPVEGHPLRQPDVLALDNLRPPGFYQAAGRAVSGAAGERRCVFRRGAEHELLRRPGDRRPGNCSSGFFPAGTTSCGC